MTILSFMNHTIFDQGASSKIGKVLAQIGVSRPLLCTDKGLVELGMVDALASNLDSKVVLTVLGREPITPTFIF